MGRTGSGVEIRAKSIRFTFLPGKPTWMLEGAPVPPTPANELRAHRLAAEIRERIKFGTFSMAEYFPASGVTVGGLTVARHLDEWLGTLRLAESTLTGYRSIVGFWKAAKFDDAGTVLGDLPLRALKPSHIKSAVARTTIGGKTVNNRVSALREALQSAVDDNMLPTNPAELVSRAKLQKPPLEPFSAAESARILAAAERGFAGPLADTVAFWFRTGLRTSELAGLRWSDVDLTTGVAVIRGALVSDIEKNTTKTSRAREVMLDGTARAALAKQKPRTFMAGAHVFVDPLTGKPWANTMAFSRRCWVPLLKLAGVPYRRPYNIRHTRATEMLMAGVRPGFAASQLGHDVAVFLGVYAKWLPGDGDAAEMAKMEPTGT